VSKISGESLEKTHIFEQFRGLQRERESQRLRPSSTGDQFMNKSELSAAVATKTGLTQSQAEAAVNGVIDAVTDTLKSGGDVRLVGFGTFSVSERAATTGRNPRTGETINIAASKQAKFKAGQALKTAVNGG
jgi:DNA-binding protein HU-beta